MPGAGCDGSTYTSVTHFELGAVPWRLHACHYSQRPSRILKLGWKSRLNQKHGSHGPVCLHCLLAFSGDGGSPSQCPLSLELNYWFCLFLFFPEQEEMRRIEEEQSFEELKILRELVHERFHKQEELAEVRNSV